MSRVRIEIWDNADNVRSAEAEHIDPQEAFNRARRMAEATLPEENKKGLTLGAGSYTFEMRNVQFTDVTKQLLFGDEELSTQGFDVKVESAEPLRQPCESPCPEEDCRNRCARPVGHEGGHVTADRGCAWERRVFNRKPELCTANCGTADCWADCQRPKDHKGEHRCNRPKDHERCLNEIGAPSATRNCQQPLNHGGLCDGEQEVLIDGMRD